MIEDPRISKVERDGVLHNQMRFEMSVKCKCGSTATRFYEDRSVCMFCYYRIRGVTA